MAGEIDNFSTRPPTRLVTCVDGPHSIARGAHQFINLLHQVCCKSSDWTNSDHSRNTFIAAADTTLSPEFTSIAALSARSAVSNKRPCMVVSGSAFTISFLIKCSAYATNARFVLTVRKFVKSS